jgi:hypothetical protein
LDGLAEQDGDAESRIDECAIHAGLNVTGEQNVGSIEMPKQMGC